MPVKVGLKPLIDASTKRRKTQFIKLGQLSDQIAILHQERYHGDTWKLLKPSNLS